MSCTNGMRMRFYMLHKGPLKKLFFWKILMEIDLVFILVKVEKRKIVWKKEKGLVMAN